MPRTIIYSILVLLVALSTGIYQLYIKPILVTFGSGRIIESIGNTDCATIPELKACEKVVLHQSTGVIYLACSTPSSRVHWTPAVGRLNATGRSEHDFIATYDPKISQVTRLELADYTGRGLSLHGMDVVPSSSNSAELFVYLVNHRKPLGDRPAKDIGADSSIEIFKTNIGSRSLSHVKTVQDPVIMTPNDIVGSSDGKSFHFTNDHGSKTGLIRGLEVLGYARTSVGFCHVDEGCKIAISKMHGNNGIARATQNDTFYVANSISGGLSVLERQSDNTLVLTDFVPTDRGLDNVSVDNDGVVWAAGLSDAITMIFKHFSDPSIPVPSSALRISINTGPTAYYGEKFKVEKVFEDSGYLASGITSIVHDSQRGWLFLHGLASPQLVVCKI